MISDPLKKARSIIRRALFGVAYTSVYLLVFALIDIPFIKSERKKK